jgi:hypothetical protein
VLTNDAVYAIPLAQRNAVPRDADALISRSLFAPGEAPVRIELPEFSGVLKDGTWTFTPQPESASADERNAWVDRWRQATAVRAARQQGAAPGGEIRIELNDGRTLALGILSREAGLVLLRPDEGVEYHFFAEAAKRMLSPPGAMTK